MGRTKAGELAMKYARAWARETYPGAQMLEAYPKRVRIPAGPKSRDEKTITLQEDLFGVFDLALFPLEFATRPMDDLVQLIQVTTLGTTGNVDGNVKARQKKVAAWVHDELGSRRPLWLGRVSVMAWVPRRHFRRWEWDWTRQEWEETPPVLAPSLRSVRTDPVRRRFAKSDNPFD